MLKPKQIKAFLGIFFIFAVIGFLLAPLSVTLYVDSQGNWEWEEYFTDDNFIYHATSFRDVQYTEIGLIGNGSCIEYTYRDKPSGYTYGEITYTFVSGTKIEKAVMEINSSSETNSGQIYLEIDGKLAYFGIGDKISDITVYVNDKEQFDLKIYFWVLECGKERDSVLHHLKFTGISEIPIDPEPTWMPTETPDPEDSDSESTDYSEPLYYRLSEYIRNEENGSLQKAAVRCVHGWLHLIKITTGVVI
ncbi:MAG: hypothetical protein HXS54_01370 [Theionarchaea archaeon]|nr:hypothetical protein [Theionarchaea archaeon]